MQQRVCTRGPTGGFHRSLWFNYGPLIPLRQEKCKTKHAVFTRLKE